jgi:hypothetical protein
MINFAKFISEIEWKLVRALSTLLTGILIAGCIQLEQLKKNFYIFQFLRKISKTAKSANQVQSAQMCKLIGVCKVQLGLFST